MNLFYKSPTFFPVKFSAYTVCHVRNVKWLKLLWLNFLTLNTYIVDTTHFIYYTSDTHWHKCFNSTSKVFLLGIGSCSISFNNNFMHCSSVALVDSVEHMIVNYCMVLASNWEMGSPLSQTMYHMAKNKD